ncbi:hypothetical protein Pst134EB_016843 [Puccinia striiformis f. sp. tritici]|nr:hypothetical protein Pst134EB_016843 [Puccinia striiformis f. sp. tritici]
MFLMIKSFLGGYLILIPLLIMLYSRGAVATKRRCDSYFGPSKNPERNYCSSDGVRYSCAVDSCKAKNKLWSSFRFRNCYMIVHGLVTTFRKEEVNPVQFHTLWWTVKVQDYGDRQWYSCGYELDYPMNALKPTCSECFEK